MKKEAKALIKLAESHGYYYVATNTKGARRYEHPAAAPVLIMPGLAENASRDIARQIRAAAGEPDVGPKRSAGAVRERQAREREKNCREVERHKALLVKLTADRDRLLCGHGADVSRAQLTALEELIARTERETAFYARLMSEVPASGVHQGSSRHARHTSGAS